MMFLISIRVYMNVGKLRGVECGEDSKKVREAAAAS